MAHVEQVIQAIGEGNLGAFGAYLQDHLRDNGHDGMSLFQPQSRAVVWPLSEKLALFQAGFATPVGEPRWRRGWVALDPRGSIIGHVDLRAHVDPHSHHRALLGMGVQRDHRGRGVGRALLRFVISWANAETTLDWVDLHFLAGNAAAEHLYRSAGFRHVATVRDMFRVDGRSVDDTSMVLRIRP